MSNTKNKNLTSYSNSIWLRGFLFISIIAFCFITYFNYVDNEVGLFMKIASFSVVVFIILAFIDSLTAKIILLQDRLLVTSNFKTKVYYKSEVSQVKRDGGSVFINLNDSNWIKIENIGGNTQSISNSIRAWLKRQ